MATMGAFKDLIHKGNFTGSDHVNISNAISAGKVLHQSSRKNCCRRTSTTLSTRTLSMSTC